MRIGILGAGQVGTTLARYLADQGHRITLANRSGGEALRALASGIPGDVRAGSRADAAGEDIVILAVPWLAVADTLSDLPPWDGRILIDATNPFTRHTPPLELDDLQGASASAVVAARAPGARVVKAFNLPMNNFVKGPAGPGGARRVLFLSGDDDGAKAIVRDLIETGGYAVVDLGNLDDGGRMQQAGGPLAGWDLLIAES